MEQKSIPISEVPGASELQAISKYLPTLNPYTGPWIAGGAVRRAMLGESLTVGDIDVFFDCRLKHKIAIADMARQATLVFESQYAKSYELEIEDKIYKVQLIIRREYQDVKYLFQDFDFTVCQFAFGGDQVITTERAWTDLNNKTLAIGGRMTGSNVVNRAMKYMTYGYEAERGLIEKLIRKAGVNSWMRLSVETSNHYDWADE